jgi:hypothetical protein
VFGEAVNEIVLAPVRFVGNDDDVAPVGQQRMLAALFIGKEFLDGGEHHAAAGDVEQLAQMFPALRLNRYLAEQLLAKGERVEKLVVQIVAVGEHDDGGILHCRVLHDFSDVENHRKTFAAPLRVPDDTRPLVTRDA